MPKGSAETLRTAALVRATSLAASTSGISSTAQNVKVNQDRNPWPKAEIAGAVDPSGKNYAVMSNDFRQNYDRMFFHSSTNGGKTFTDDAMVQGFSPYLGFSPFSFQSDPGLSFDANGLSYLSTISGNAVFDFTNGYLNFDTEIEVAQGYANGTYASLVPTAIDDQPCNGLLSGALTCDASLDKPLITTDAVAGSPNLGTTYVYYTFFCNSPVAGFCTDGSATNIPAFSSVILESHSAGAGLPFSLPAQVSGTLTQAQFSNMVVDSQGTPHVFFDDFTGSPNINMWEARLTEGTWVVSAQPVASFTFNGLANPNWSFRDLGAVAPGCGGRGDSAYCAFSASQIAGGSAEGTASVYLASINLKKGTSSVHRVNNDAVGNLKDHFFGWATATSKGVFVGWYDNRKDPFGIKVEYYVGLSTDGGKTFPTQKAISDAPFNPCVGFPGCGFFGDYTQLVSGSDGVVHAAWSDTRDGASMQIYSQSVSW